MRWFQHAFLCTALWLPACGAVHAQALTLSPAVIALKGGFGQGTTQVLELKNGSDQAMDFDISVRDVVVRDGKRAFVEAGTLTGSIAVTAVVSPARVHIGPHDAASVSLTLTVPHQARHRAVVAVFNGRAPVSIGGQPARLGIGALLTFTLSDKMSLASRGFEVRPPSTHDNAQLRATLVNDGEEPVVPSGMAAILDDAGRIIGKAPFGATRLLPGEIRTMTADYPGELNPGQYRAVATFDAQGTPLTLTAPFTLP